MKYLIGAICAIIVSLTVSFNSTKCNHVFTEVEQAAIKVERSIGWTNANVTVPLTGIHEGKELICVKCFHVQKQVVDYGETYGGLRLSDCPSFMVPAGPFSFDSATMLKSK